MGRQRSVLPGASRAPERRAIALAGVLAGAWAACASPPEQRTAQAPASGPAAPAPGQAPSPTCPATARAPELPPGTTAEHLRPAYWLERTGALHDLDQVLMSPADIARLNASFEVPREGFHAQDDLLAPLDTALVRAELDQRMGWLRSQFESGAYVTRAGRGWPTQIAAAATPAFQPRLHVALAQVPFYCAPTTEGFFVPNGNPNIDRNRCSTAHPQEPIQVLADWPGAMQFARTRYTWGWIADDAALSPPLTDEQATRFVRGPFATLSQPAGAQGVEVPAGRLLPRPDARAPSVLVATARGITQVAVPADRLRPAPRPLTRRAVIEEAFRYLGTPYGFGDKDGGRDCSRLLLDIFESFGVRMPRHSSWQARAGTYSIDLAGAGESDRLLLLDAAAARGVVLLHLPGHIMLYLGRDRDQRPMALHALGEYKTRCADDSGETLFYVDDILVTDLELGRGTDKTALIERIDRMTVLGPAPDMELAGAAELRPAAPVSAPDECRERSGARIFVSPARPDSSRPLRVIVTMDRDPGPAAIALVDPAGGRHMPPLVRLGGPPYGYVTTIEAPARGRWTAVFGDGDDVHACERVQVHSRPQGPRKAAPLAEASDDAEASPDPDARPVASPAAGPAANPVWKVRRAWTPAMEDLYAVFVERLFDYPLEEDVTWAGLHHLVRDRERNILHDYLGLGEDDALTLIPDCADLPYTLRAYFAWKLGLPFGYHACGRARPGKPPHCEPAGDNLMSRSALTESSVSERGPAPGSGGAGKPRERLHPDVVAFARFVDRAVRRGVHSSSGRTHPDDDSTDFYPVPLTRRDLRPGTLFADPYGHLLILVDWLPQGAGRYGVLVGADAQPDGTVGRRRFWPGSFLFDPDTRSGGAGFKAFRPWQPDEQAPGRLMSPGNRDLRDRRVAPFSKAQYQGSTEDFYDAMDALINPRPLDPRAMLGSLVDALAETVSRRVTSVQNGEDFMRTRGFAPIDMPSGADIFLTTGPWEDYATPSRDFRLLVSIDTVLGFPDAVARAPQRFGVRGGRDEVAAVVAELRRTLESELAARSFQYVRSDRGQQTVTLAALVERQRELEIAYNPNDCPEVRWGAPQGSAELQTCARRAPPEQRTRMDRVRTWFSTRKRPAN
jgi:cell wall-associated NlpC family hydrolase